MLLSCELLHQLNHLRCSGLQLVENLISSGCLHAPHRIAEAMEPSRMPQNSTALETKASSAPSALCWAKEKYSGFFRAEYGGKVDALTTMLCDHFENHKETIFEKTEHDNVQNLNLRAEPKNTHMSVKMSNHKRSPLNPSH